MGRREQPKVSGAALNAGKEEPAVQNHSGGVSPYSIAYRVWSHSGTGSVGDHSIAGPSPQGTPVLWVIEGTHKPHPPS